jgi:hypothetical protein
MDMQRFITAQELSPGEAKLRRHCEAIRRNKDVLASIFTFLNEDPPNASAAQECLEELSQEDQIALWSVSPTAGGVWHTWERDALKYGDLYITNSWSVYAARNNNRISQP